MTLTRAAFERLVAGRSRWAGGHRRWTGPHSNGYGRLHVPGTSGPVGVHRLALAVRLGRPLRRHEHALHVRTCPFKDCFADQHLYLGDDRANVADQMASGRHLFGERIWNAKLTRSRVRAGRLLRREGWRVRPLAALFRVHPTAMGRALARKTWSWIA